jgi:hypothetical protein
MTEPYTARRGGNTAELARQRREAESEGLTVRQVALRKAHYGEGHAGHGYQPRCPACNPASRDREAVAA